MCMIVLKVEGQLKRKKSKSKWMTSNSWWTINGSKLESKKRESSSALMVGKDTNSKFTAKQEVGSPGI